MADYAIANPPYGLCLRLLRFLPRRMKCFACDCNDKCLRQINATGKSVRSPKVCPALPAKIFPLPRRANQTFNSARLAATRGAIAIVTNVRWDAMDARLRLTSAAFAYGEIDWVRRPDAGVKFEGG